MIKSPDSFISLRRLYSFVERHRTEFEQALNLEHDLGAQYSRACEELTKDIDEVQGIYVWGRFDERRYWKSIYLGKAGLGKSKKLLRDRITEELKDERCFLWRTVLTEADLFCAGPKVHRGGQEKWDGYIHKAWKRSVRKAGTTHIVFASTKMRNNDGVREVEADLIEALGPEANVSKPIPPSHVTEEASSIFSDFRRTIHHIRGLRRFDGGPLRIDLV